MSSRCNESCNGVARMALCFRSMKQLEGRAPLKRKEAQWGETGLLVDAADTCVSQDEVEIAGDGGAKRGSEWAGHAPGITGIGPSPKSGGGFGAVGATAGLCSCNSLLIFWRFPVMVVFSVLPL
jgi:hypothetical protein